MTTTSNRYNYAKIHRTIITLCSLTLFAASIGGCDSQDGGVAKFNRDADKLHAALQAYEPEKDLVPLCRAVQASYKSMDKNKVPAGAKNSAGEIFGWAGAHIENIDYALRNFNQAGAGGNKYKPLVNSDSRLRKALREYSKERSGA